MKKRKIKRKKKINRTEMKKHKNNPIKKKNIHV